MISGHSSFPLSQISNLNLSLLDTIRPLHGLIILKLIQVTSRILNTLIIPFIPTMNVRLILIQLLVGKGCLNPFVPEWGLALLHQALHLVDTSPGAIKVLFQGLLVFRGCLHAWVLVCSGRHLLSWRYRLPALYWFWHSALLTGV